MPKFKIEEFVEFDTKGRAICPACSLSKGSGYSQKNLSLVGDSGAYKCHRGCSPEEIRAALNQPIDRQIPTAIATPQKNATVNPQKVREAHEALLKNNEAMGWLDDRGIDRAAVVRHKLGLTRSKQGAHHIPAVTIPIPANETGTQYYQKKRIAPWVTGDDRPSAWSTWSQYGIPQMVYFTHKPPEAKETWLCEGEWDAIRLAMDMRYSTMVAIACFTCGAGNVPPQEQLDRLPGKVTILYDYDDSGKKGALKVQDRLRDRAFIAAIEGDNKEAPTGWDVSDALNSSDLRAIEQAIAIAKPWTKPKAENPLMLRLKTNDQLMSEAQDYVEWLVPDLLTCDELFILGMPPRGGKSLFCLTLAKAVATGGNFLDRPVTQGSVIYVNLEDAPTKIKYRQIAQGWSENLPVYWLDKFKLSELDQLKQIADELPDLRLIVLDTFSRIRDDNQKESSAELGRTLEPLQEFAKERGVTILITHHTGKTNAEHTSADPFDALRGSTSIRATCRGAIVIVPGEHSYRLLAENGYTDRLDINVSIKSDTLEWKMLGNWTPRVDGDMKAQILDHLNLHGEGTVAQIARELSFNATSVGTIMSRLHRDDLVTKEGGKGRAPAIYRRSLNLLKQQELEFKQPNPDGVSDTALLKQLEKSEVSSEKVIILEESDQNPDHFCKKDPKHTDLFKQSYSPDPVSVPCFNEGEGEFKQIEATKLAKRKRGITPGCLVRYIGHGSKSRICSGKKLQVLSIADGSAEVTHDDWYVTQTIPLADLRLTN